MSDEALRALQRQAHSKDDLESWRGYALALERVLGVGRDDHVLVTVSTGVYSDAYVMGHWTLTADQFASLVADCERGDGELVHETESFSHVPKGTNYSARRVEAQAFYRKLQDMGTKVNLPEVWHGD